MYSATKYIYTYSHLHNIHGVHEHPSRDTAGPSYPKAHTGRDALGTGGRDRGRHLSQQAEASSTVQYGTQLSLARG